MTELIHITQKPVISHQMDVISEEVTRYIESLNIENLVATEETVTFLKKLAADLTKRLSSYDDQIKFVEKEYNVPILAIKNDYKAKISTKISEAILKVRNQILIVDTKRKAEIEKNVRSYFEDLCKISDLDFITFEKSGININLSTSEKKYKEQCNEIINKIKDDLSLIETETYKVEILVQYKRTLNVSQAIKDVRFRKAQEAEEQRKIDEANQRAIEATQAVVPETVITQPAPVVQASEPLKAPEVCPTHEEIFTASFMVSETREKILKLAEFLKTNNYNYKNI